MIEKGDDMSIYGDRDPSGLGACLAASAVAILIFAGIGHGAVNLARFLARSVGHAPLFADLFRSAQ